LKPTQEPSGPKFIDRPKASPFLPRRRLPMPFVPCTVRPFSKADNQSTARI